MPLVVLGNGMINKDHIKFGGKMVGVGEKNLRKSFIEKAREETLLMLIKEYCFTQVNIFLFLIS